MAQGFYVVLAFSPTRGAEPNVARPRLLASNWRNLWRALRALPQYEAALRGRVLADLVNEPARWGCQWDRECRVPASAAQRAAAAAGGAAGGDEDEADGGGGGGGHYGGGGSATAANNKDDGGGGAAAAAASQDGGGDALACAPGAWLFAAAASAIHSVDPAAPVLIEGLGQEQQRGAYRACSRGFYPGIHWGDGFVTNRQALRRHNLSDPSALFAADDFVRLGPGAALGRALGARGGGGGGGSARPGSKKGVTVAASGPPTQVVLAPHLYPASITGAAAALEAEAEVAWRWDLSWGWKARGLDRASDGATPLRDAALLVGEFGTRDGGDNSVANADTTVFSAQDRDWLRLLARYLDALGEKAGGPVSWLHWGWAANAADTKGIVGPMTTWREVQWTKVRMLTRLFGLRPWYCGAISPEFCATVEWDDAGNGGAGAGAADSAPAATGGKKRRRRQRR